MVSENAFDLNVAEVEERSSIRGMCSVIIKRTFFLTLSHINRFAGPRVFNIGL